MDARSEADKHLALLKGAIKSRLPLPAEDSQQVCEHWLSLAPRAVQADHGLRLPRKLQYRVLCVGVAVGTQLHRRLGVCIDWLSDVGKNTRSNLLQKIVALALKPLVYIGNALTKLVVFSGERACLLLQRHD